MVILSRIKGGAHMSYGYGNNFVLIVVLFILLIIVGATFVC
ncbi:YjcZ family sporulation protein [Pontibacillus sp. ALD_SL1]